MIFALLTCLYMATYSDLGLTLNTPSNNQQSAQQVGTFNVNQAGSNAYPYVQQGMSSGGLIQANSLNGYGNTDQFRNNPVVTNNDILSPKAPSPKGGWNNTGYNDQAAYDLAKALEAERGQSDQLINEAYGASANYLNQAEGALRADYPTVLNDIQGQYDAGARLAESGKTSTLGTINDQQITADQRNQSVMADARRLYDELRRGYGQRFGGASSAGQAASEISAVEQQRQQGKIQQDYGNTLRQIETARTQVEQKYQDQLFQLENTKKTAINEANRDFQNKLLQISQSRAENEQAKAQARLSALQDLRNKVYQINLQNLQFQQTLQAQKQQADLGLSSYTNELSGLGASAQTATNSFTPEVSSNLQTSSNTTNTTTNPYVGNILSDSRKKFTDLFVGGGGGGSF